MKNIWPTLQRKRQRIILQYAIMRWESTVVLALTLVLLVFVPRPFHWWPPLGWLWLGLVGVGVLVYTSLHDADNNARLVDELYQTQLDPRRVRDDLLRQAAASALEYRRQIERQIQRQRTGAIRDRLADTVNQLDNWLNTMYQLVQRIDAYRADHLLQQERAMLPRALEQLYTQRRQETCVATQQQLDASIAGKENHWQTLCTLDARMNQATCQVEQSLTALATVYRQVQLIDAQTLSSGQTERLQIDIREQVERLADLVSGINEVFDDSHTVNTLLGKG